MQPTPPYLAPSSWWWTQVSGATSPLGVAVRHVICGDFFPPSYVALWDSKTLHRPAGERVSWCLETSPPSRLPPQDGSPSLTLLSLFLPIIFCPTSFWRQWAVFLGASCPLSAFRSCFVEFAVFQWSFDEFVGEKVVSLSYFSTILGPPPVIFFIPTTLSLYVFLLFFPWLSGCSFSVSFLDFFPGP